MKNVLKFPRKIRKYSEKLLSDVSPLAIPKYVQEKEVNVNWRAACAIVDAEMAIVYRDLVLEEEGIDRDTIEGIFKSKEQDTNIIDGEYEEKG